VRGTALPYELAIIAPVPGAVARPALDDGGPIRAGRFTIRRSSPAAWARTAMLDPKVQVRTLR
jgi:hypothetical protein